MRATYRLDDPKSRYVEIGDRLAPGACVNWDGNGGIVGEHKVRTVAATYSAPSGYRWFLVTSKEDDPRLVGPGDYRHWFLIEDDPPEPKQVKVKMWWHPTRAAAFWTADQLQTPWRKNGFTLVEIDATEVL